MPSTGIPATCWFNRWYLFHEGQQENRRYPYGKGEAPRRIFCRKRYPARPCGLPEQKIAGAGLHKRPGGTRRPPHTSVLPARSPRTGTIFFQNTASETLRVFPEKQNVLHSGPPMWSPACFVFRQPSGSAQKKAQGRAFARRNDAAQAFPPRICRRARSVSPQQTEHSFRNTRPRWQLSIF